MLAFCITKFFCNRFTDFGFREGHYKIPLLNFIVISSPYMHFHVEARICQGNKQVILESQSNC
jgi:hypothetical protein